ncbi:hypothetical protein AVEN_86775-1 [Araneus ventricosus]|uniref:Uncharacterized protein n=1 Tax=Araneus ventricosus TaxID=182803 RepID=A0A4Y2TNL7_ARAVE|nr:hypothetical protein AVEN_86775-1 [Araneus ventricosus]
MPPKERTSFDKSSDAKGTHTKTSETEEQNAGDAERKEEHCPRKPSQIEKHDQRTLHAGVSPDGIREREQVSSRHKHSIIRNDICSGIGEVSFPPAKIDSTSF